MPLCEICDSYFSLYSIRDDMFNMSTYRIKGINHTFTYPVVCFGCARKVDILFSENFRNR